MRRRWLALAVIVTVTSGCDNVAWGGVDMRLEPPPAKARPAVANEGPEGEEAVPLPDLPDGPLLLAGTRDGSSATLVVVGEIQGDAVGALPPEEEVPGLHDRVARELLAPGTELVLFSEGVRVGRLVASDTGLDEGFCPPRPTVTGTVELVPSASGAQRLLAVPESRGGRRPYAPFQARTDDRDQRVASLNLASTAIVQESVPWPPSLLEARADVQAFQLEGEEGPGIAATFLYEDRLSVGEPAGPGAYALFILGTSRPGGYDLRYSWYRRADDEGKGAPRYFGHMDWDGDGDSEILLDVLGTERRWYAGLARADGSWTRSFQDSCGTGPDVAGD